MKLFDLDSPIMRVLSRVADLMMLNIITLICCLPVVTAGAALTALHYMTLKLVRGEEGYILKGYFKSFKQNFKQATIIWLILLFVTVILIGDFYIMNNLEVSYGTVIKVIIMIVAIMVTFTATFVFPVLAKFDNTIGRTIKNALVISLLQFPKTILMIILNIAPVLLLLVIQLVPLSMLFGFSAPAFASAFLYNKFFKKLEAQILEKNGDATLVEKVPDEERIFHDELDESISINENRH